MNTAVLLACFTLPSAVFGFELNYLGPDANFSKVPMDSEMPPVLIAKGFDPNKLNISILTSITFSGEMFAMQMIGIAPIQLALDRISSSGLLDAYNIKVEVVDDNVSSCGMMQ